MSEPEAINIEGTEIKTADLTPEQRSLVLAIQELDNEITPARRRLAALEVSRNSTLQSLKATLGSKKKGLFGR